MSDESSVGAAILDLLAQAGVEVVFGLPGVHNLPMWSAHRPGHPRIVGVRHEQTAVYAADGYARATGRIGVALTTTGPGAANTVAAFGEAAACGSPVLVISSDVSRALRTSGPGSPDLPRGILHEMADQAALFTPFTDRAATAIDGRHALDLIAAALSAAGTTPTGPAYVGVPSDVMAHDAADLVRRESAVAASPPGPSESDVAGLAEAVAGAGRVIIWAGGGVVQCGTAGESALRAVAESLGAPVVTTYAGRGLMAGHPLAVEAPVHEPQIADLIAGADLLLVVGSGFDAMNTRNWRMPLPATTVAIGLDPALARTIVWTHRVEADLVATLRALLDRLPAQAREPWADLGVVDVMRRGLKADPRVTEALEVVSAVEGWPADGVVVCDMAVAGYWVGGYAVQPRPRRMQYPVGWGTLGYALPAAIGPAAVGIATLAVCGDGGPMFALGELATMAQERLPLTLLVVDDGGYGMLRFDQQVFGHPERGVDLLTPEWTTLAAAFGLPCTQVTDAAGLGSALQQASASGGPGLVLLNARLYPPRTTSPRWAEPTE